LENLQLPFARDLAWQASLSIRVLLRKRTYRRVPHCLLKGGDRALS
jgi:hypothetical protein